MLEWKESTMRSANIINYEVRACKFVERRMFIATISRIMGYFHQQYQYIGFGGLAFTDFKLFHKELNIDELYSIENSYGERRIELNKPFSTIKVVRGKSTEKLPDLHLEKPSIVWLDYDNELSDWMFTDASIILNRLPVGGVFITSCNSTLNGEDDMPMKAAKLKELFGDLVPQDVATDCCTPENAPATIRRMFMNICLKVVDGRRKKGSNIRFQPLYNIVYADGGARMFSFGGVVLDDETTLDNLNVSHFPFINTESPFVIQVPNLTLREIIYINQYIDDDESLRKIVNEGIVKQSALQDYLKIYKYMPNYFDVRL